LWAIGSLFAVEENRHAASVADFSVDYFVTIHNETLASKFAPRCAKHNAVQNSAFSFKS